MHALSHPMRYRPTMYSVDMPLLSFRAQWERRSLTDMLGAAGESSNSRIVDDLGLKESVQ